MKRASLAIAAYVAVTGLAAACNVSFASTTLNALVLATGYVLVATVLCVAAFRCKPVWLGVVAGSLLATGFAAVFYLVALSAAIFYPWQPDYESEEGGLVCRAVYFGITPSEVRIEVRVFRPYFFGLERRLYSETLDDVAFYGTTPLHGCPPVMVHEADH